MIKIVFVGDEPSKKNISKDIPFVGAKCFARLVEWIAFINPEYYVVLNSKVEVDLLAISELHKAGFKVIALGVKASKRLTNSRITHYKIDHPSSLNRKLNNHEYVHNMLVHVTAWMYEF